MATMLEPDTIRQFILPLHKKVIDIVHNKNKKFLLHCCGNIKEIMPDILQNGIDAKHSNEDQICLFDEWYPLRHKVLFFLMCFPYYSIYLVNCSLLLISFTASTIA